MRACLSAATKLALPGGEAAAADGLNRPGGFWRIAAASTGRGSASSAGGMGASGGRDETTDDGAEDERRDADDVGGGCGLLLGEGSVGCGGEAGGASAADTHASRDGDDRRDGGGCTASAAGGGEAGAATGASPNVNRLGAIFWAGNPEGVFSSRDWRPRALSQSLNSARCAGCRVGMLSCLIHITKPLASAPSSCSASPLPAPLPRPKRAHRGFEDGGSKAPRVAGSDAANAAVADGALP